eukprot:NODE_26_length_40862_cov_0.679513.p10 type:complete len:435 gc:universal NODE_26_length_40862_cov_0.679513:24065-22761(-)
MFITTVLATNLSDLINKNPKIHVPKPVKFTEDLGNNFRGDFQSDLKDITVDVKLRFPNMKLQNVNLDSAEWVMDASCTESTVSATLDQFAPTSWPEKAFVFIGHRWCIDVMEKNGPWFVATNIQKQENTVSMNVVPARPEDYADYFEVIAKLVKKERVRKRELDRDFQWITMPYCFNEQTHGTCQKDMQLHQDENANIVCEDCWAYLNFGFLYKATGRVRKLNRGLSSTINMAAKGEMNFDIKIESRSTFSRGYEKYFDATKLISKIIPIIDIPDVLQLHPEASLWTGAHVKVVQNMDARFGIEGTVDFEATTESNVPPMKRFNYNLVPHPSSVEILENKGQADVTLTADISLVFNLLNGLLTDRAGTYLDSTVGIQVDGLSEKCPNEYEYQLVKGYELGLHIHSNRKVLKKVDLSPIQCRQCSGCLSVGSSAQ